MQKWICPDFSPISEKAKYYSVILVYYVQCRSKIASSFKKEFDCQYASAWLAKCR